MKTWFFVAIALTAGFLAIGTAIADSDKASTASLATEKAADKAAKHSHVQEKTGIPQSMPEQKADKPNPAKDVSKHYHPRDNK
ncbi:MAG: hypothetical protein RKP46_17195 [Candidatus Accumulibacter sp.]|uniref:hypothetical protein n=1 Tax=Accumulibacter sp. TaxID=2053492 RepID=UPI00287A469A|nr:hypothetical protein [Accumulibacter sp.]MDS4016067.1 hypothetical protein [Accumulibacter sp.]